jgi:hypothetical protein
MPRFIARQGDVLIMGVETIPDGLSEIPRENGRVVLARGEVTGHAHAIDSEHALFLAADLDEMTDRFLQVEQDAWVDHEEHGTIPLPAGNYIVRRQREYAPEAIRIVAD